MVSVARGAKVVSQRRRAQANNLGVPYEDEAKYLEQYRVVPTNPKRVFA